MELHLKIKQICLAQDMWQFWFWLVLEFKKFCWYEHIAEGVTDKSNGNRTLIQCWCLVIWFHDECIFYAHDQHIICWVHSLETAKPYAKGEGQSLMVADFVSANYSFLSSAEGAESTCIEIKPGKNRDGVSGNTVSWGLKLLCYPLCLQRSNTEE